MAAILGTLVAPIETICAKATAEAGLVVPANYNSAEQVVISGEVAAWSGRWSWPRRPAPSAVCRCR
jgi:malonyl CoA-acyl carrier protein transacylase